MKFVIVSLLLLSAQVSTAQVFQVKYITSTDSAKTFLKVESAQRPAAAKQIMATISKDWGYNPGAVNPFANLNMVEEADFGFEVGANNERVFSIEVESSYASCGLHITRYEYHFDANTGASIDFNKLFGTEGQVKLRKALNKSWKAALKVAVTDKDDFHLDEYKACLADKSTETSPHRMMIMNDGIKFWAGTCVEGTAYDFEADKGQGPHFYSLGKLLPMLTYYGYYRFLDNWSDSDPGPIQKLMRGTIDGKYPISLTLLPGSKEIFVNGIIVYDRVGEPINLTGTISGNQVAFSELDDSGNPLSNIEVDWDGNKLTGTFTNLKSKKQMPFVATVVK